MSIFSKTVESQIFKAFNEESFSHQGKYFTIPPEVPYRGYDLKEITLVPRPIHRPVEMWQPVASGRSIDFMAKHGIHAMLSLNGERLTDQIMRQYQADNAKYGRHLELGENTCLGMGFCMDDTVEKAVNRVRPYHDERYKWFAPFGFVRYTDEQGRMWGTPGHRRACQPSKMGCSKRHGSAGHPNALLSIYANLK